MFCNLEKQFRSKRSVQVLCSTWLKMLQIKMGGRNLIKQTALWNKTMNLYTVVHVQVSSAFLVKLLAEVIGQVSSVGSVTSPRLLLNYLTGIMERSFIFSLQAALSSSSLLWFCWFFDQNKVKIKWLLFGQSDIH